MISDSALNADVTMNQSGNANAPASASAIAKQIPRNCGSSTYQNRRNAPAPS